MATQCARRRHREPGGSLRLRTRIAAGACAACSSTNEASACTASAIRSAVRRAGRAILGRDAIGRPASRSGDAGRLPIVERARVAFLARPVDRLAHMFRGEVQIAGDALDLGAGRADVEDRLDAADSGRLVTGFCSEMISDAQTRARRTRRSP